MVDPDDVESKSVEEIEAILDRVGDDTSYESDENSDDSDEQLDTKEFYVENVRLHGSGMVTIPHRLRDRYDVDPYDVLDIIVYGGEMPFQATDIVVQGDERIRIPEGKRVLYGIEDGDPVDLEIATTGLTFPPEEL